MKKKVAIIGQFPPPIHGLSKAIDTLCNSRIKDEFELDKIDIKDNKKFLLSLIKILKSKDDLYYLTISQSKFGNIRDLIIMKLIQMKKRKLIIHLHGGGFRQLLDTEWGKFQKNLNKKILKKVDGAIVLGESLKYIFQDIIPNEKIFVVENCVDNEFVLTDLSFEKKFEMFRKKNTYKILYLSNFIKEKGYFKVLELAKYYKDNEIKEYRFIFAGKFFSNEDKNEFLEYIEKNELTDLVEYRGIVQGKEKIEIFEECDIIILLTNYKNEGQPITLIEGAINGLMICTTDHAGICDIVNEKNSILLKNRFVENKVIDALLFEKLKNKQMWIEILKENRANMKLNFSQEKYIQSLDEKLRDI